MTRKAPLLGVIEGFYGQPWPQESRLQMMGWLPQLGLEAYLYAPKADAVLRKQWRADWPPAHRAHLEALARRCESSGLEFAVGLSPYALYADYGERARAELKHKIERIRDLGELSLALLFDDMPGELPDLARRQLEIVHDIRHWQPDLGLRVCPTYYSDDPVLDKVFGERPRGYLEALGQGLPEGLELFWTGTQVCSPAVSREDLAPVMRDSRCSLALWDNYPVNDSRVRSDHLYLAPLDRRPGELRDCLGSHWCNAMNQPALSLPALASLAAVYQTQPATETGPVFAAAGLDEELLAACLPLAREGLSTLSPPRRRELGELAKGPGLARRELGAWLAGTYRFDPACLTD